jgi:putative membrane protein insertion efficiency factor
MRFHPRRLTGPFILLAVVAAFAFDASRPPAAQWTTRAALAGIHLYQRTASPYMPSIGVRCRFTPTCSHYAEAVLARHGIVRGTGLTVVRLARCGPWTAAGTEDLPP